MNRLQGPHAEILQRLATIWSAEQFLVVGAVALAHHIGLSWRGTQDLDLSAAFGVQDCERFLGGLGWKRTTATHRWSTPEGVRIDVIPAEASLIRQGGFDWPNGGHMNLVGFRLAFADAERVEIAPDAVVNVASLRSLFALKAIAYLDRPWERDNDLADIAHIMARFVDDDAEERWSSRVLALEIDYEDVGPFLLGEQLSTRLDDVERARVLEFLAVADDPDEAPFSTIHRMARHSPPTWRNPEVLCRRLTAIRRGLESE